MKSIKTKLAEIVTLSIVLFLGSSLSPVMAKASAKTGEGFNGCSCKVQSNTKSLAHEAPSKKSVELHSIKIK